MSNKNEKKLKPTEYTKPLIDDEDDYLYEKALAYEVIAKRKQAEELKKKKEREEVKAREKRIHDEKIELMKLKTGVIDNSETIKEEHEVIEEAHGWAKITNIWYRDKYLVLFAVFLIVITGYIVYTEVTRERPDMTVLMVADNDLQFRQSQLEKFFEKYTDDFDGNGYVHVQVVMIPISKNYKDLQMQNTYQSKLVAQLQLGENIMVITDSNTEAKVMSVMENSLPGKFPDNKYVDDKGLSLNMKLVADQLDYPDMPYDIYLSMRHPVKTTGDSLETMQKNYDKSLKVFTKMAEDLSKQAEETNDPGLKTAPKKYDESSNAQPE